MRLYRGFKLRDTLPLFFHGGVKQLDGSLVRSCRKESNAVTKGSFALFERPEPPFRIF